MDLGGLGLHPPHHAANNWCLGSGFPGLSVVRRHTEAGRDSLEAIQWSFKLSAKDDKVLQDDKLPGSFQKLLDKGLGACEKLLKDTLKLQKEVTGEKQKQLKDGYAAISKHLQAMDHVKNFVELPDGNKLTMMLTSSSGKQLGSDVEDAPCLDSSCAVSLGAF